MPSHTKITWKYPKMYCIWKKSKSRDYVYHDLSYAFKEGTEHVHTCVNMERTGPFTEVITVNSYSGKGLGGLVMVTEIS